MNDFIRAMVRIFSFGERWNVLFNSAIASLNRTFHLSPHENILTIALINIHYLYNMSLHPNHQACYTVAKLSRDVTTFIARRGKFMQIDSIIKLGSCLINT